MFFCEENEAKLYYLYMLADGEVSDEEEKLFNEICKKLKVEENEKMSIIEVCKSMSQKGDNTLDIITNAGIDISASKSIFNTLRSKADLTRVIWNLINLGYADSVYCEAEKQIVNYLVNEWSVDMEIYNEFINTSEVILALTKQKEWLKSVNISEVEKHEKEKNINDNIAQLMNDIKITISELEM